MDALTAWVLGTISVVLNGLGATYLWIVRQKDIARAKAEALQQRERQRTEKEQEKEQARMGVSWKALYEEHRKNLEKATMAFDKLVAENAQQKVTLARYEERAAHAQAVIDSLQRRLEGTSEDAGGD